MAVEIWRPVVSDWECAIKCCCSAFFGRSMRWECLVDESLYRFVSASAFRAVRDEIFSD